MAKIYARKIINGEINQETGQIWKLADVPIRWRAATEKILNESM